MISIKWKLKDKKNKERDTDQCSEDEMNREDRDESENEEDEDKDESENEEDEDKKKEDNKRTEDSKESEILEKETESNRFHPPLPVQDLGSNNKNKREAYSIVGTKMCQFKLSKH